MHYQKADFKNYLYYLQQISTYAGTDDKLSVPIYIQAKASEQHTAYSVGYTVGLPPTDSSVVDFSKVVANKAQKWEIKTDYSLYSNQLLS